MWNRSHENTIKVSKQYSSPKGNILFVQVKNMPSSHVLFIKFTGKRVRGIVKEEYLVIIMG